MRHLLRVVAVILAAMPLGCSSPTEPTGAATTASYAGEWTGTTSQGSPIAFTIVGESVTTLTLGHNFGGCSGVRTFTNLNLSIVPDIVCVPGPCTAAMQSERGFSFFTGGRESFTQLTTLSMRPSSAMGGITFSDLDSCGTATGVSWTAAKR